MKLPYEIHATVIDVEALRFQQICTIEQVKPVLLELQSRTNGMLKDAMTSSTIRATLYEAIEQAAQLAKRLETVYQLKVPRLKLETVPWHPLALNPATRAEHQYLECHLQLALSEDDASGSSWDNLVTVCGALDLHLSRNVFKRTIDNKAIYMATLRNYTATPAYFAELVDTCHQVLQQHTSADISKTDIEFAIMDTNPNHDRMWMT